MMRCFKNLDDLENSNYGGAAEGFSGIVPSGSVFVPYAHLKRAIAFSNQQKA